MAGRTMTHEYSLLLGGVILGAPEHAAATALAWAGDTILAIGDDDSVLAVSRGDSHVARLGGAFVLAAEPDGRVRWPPSAPLDVGGRADFAVLAGDPRASGPDVADGYVRVVARVRGGIVVEGRLGEPPGRGGLGDPSTDHGHDADPDP